MTQLLLDEMLSPKIAEALRSAGIDVVSVSAEPNLRGLADSDVLDWAASEGRVLVTDNIKDFAVLNAQWATSPRKHPGRPMASSISCSEARGDFGRMWSVRDHIRAKSAGTEQPPETLVVSGRWVTTYGQSPSSLTRRDFGQIPSLRDHIRPKSRGTEH